MTGRPDDAESPPAGNFTKADSTAARSGDAVGSLAAPVPLPGGGADSTGSVGAAFDSTGAPATDTGRRAPADSVARTPGASSSDPPKPLFSDAGGWNIKAARMVGQEDVNGFRHILIDVILTQKTTLITAPRGYYYPDTEKTALGGGVRLTDSTLVVLADSAAYSRNRQEFEAWGNVRVRDGGLGFSGRSGTFNRMTDVLTLTDTVRGEQEGRLIRGDRLEYRRAVGTALITGRATIEDPARRSVVSGARILYDTRTREAAVTEAPALDWARGENTVRIEGERLRFLDDGNRFEAVGKVVVRQDRQTATADSAIFYDREGYGELYGSPHVTDAEGDLSGERLHLRFENSVMESAVMHGNASLVYIPTDPALAGERSIVRGDSMTVFFAAGRIEHIEAHGSPNVDYRPSLADSATGTGRVTAGGDTVVVRIKGQAADRVEVSGNASGRYLYRSGAAPDSVDRVDYAANRIIFNLPDRRMELRGAAQTDYHNLTLKADRIDFDAVKDMLEASPKPILIDKSRPGDQELVGQRVTYDLTSSRGTIYHGRTRYDEGHIFADSLRKVTNTEFSANHGKYTTCDLVAEDEDPHFHFVSRRMKIYLGDKVVAKPVVLYIGKIPVFALPFYVFSLRHGRHSGLLLPRFEFGFNSTSGRFFENLGYYWAASDYTDYTLRLAYRENPGVLISEGTAVYTKRNLVDGQVDIGHAWGLDRGLNQVRVAHNQTLGQDARLTVNGEFEDPEFRSLRGLGAGIGSRVDRQLTSRAGLTKSWRDQGISLSVTGSQEKSLDADLNDGIDEITLNRVFPSVSASLNQRTIGRKATSDRPAFLPWAQTLTYRLTFSGNRREQTREVTTRIAATDSTAGDTTAVAVRTDTESAAWRFSIGDQRKVLGFINITPSLNLNENWVDREFSAIDTAMGFRRAATYSLSLGVNSTAYGTFFPRIGPLVALRHTISPSVSLSYNPEFRNLTFADSNGVRRNRFPGVGAVESQTLSYSLDNRFQAKLKSGDDIKRAELFSWRLNGSYNLLAAKRGEDRPASNISSAVDLNRIKNISLNFRTTHDPYRQLRVESLSLQSSLAISGALPGSSSDPSAGPEQSEAIRPPTPGFDSKPTLYQPAAKGGLSGGEVLSWSANFGLSYSGSRGGDGSLDTRANLNSGFRVNLTQNWGMNYSTAYSFETKELTYQRLDLTRKLHCWEASFSYSATPLENEFYFRINVIALPDIKFERGPGLGALGTLNSFSPGGGF